MVPLKLAPVLFEAIIQPTRHLLRPQTTSFILRLLGPPHRPQLSITVQTLTTVPTQGRRGIINLSLVLAQEECHRLGLRNR